MTRFRAFASDDSSSSDEETQQKPTTHRPQARYDDDDDSDPEESEEEREQEQEDGNESSSESSTSSAEMLENELVYGKSRSRLRTALVEDENGEIQVTGDEDMEDASGSSSGSSRSSSTPEPRGVVGDPNIIPWARQIGVDAQKMHVMQTSLFRVPEEAAALKALNQPTGRHRALNLQPPSLGLNRKHSRDSDGDGLRHDSRERASFAHEIDQGIFRPSRKYARVEINSSIAQGKEGDYVDSGLAFGRSFRVGWGPGGTLVHVGTICGPFSTPSSANTSIVSITKTPFPPAETPTQETSPQALATKLLQHHLTFTPVVKDDSGIPHAQVKAHVDSLNFSSFANLFPITDAVDPAPLFRLGSALFDPIDLHLDAKIKTLTSLPGATTVTPDVRIRITLLRRRRALSKWLETVVSPSVEGDSRPQGTAGPVGSSISPTDRIFSQLTGHQISQACMTAMDAGYVKLATLVSQAGGDDTFRSDIQDQLEIWRQDKLSPNEPPLPGGVKGLINKGIWKVYQLLGGPPFDENDEAAMANWVEDVCMGLDWKRILGLCLWYGTGLDAPVAEVVRLYEGLLRRHSTIPIARPLPKWYLDRKPGQPSSNVLAPFGSRSGIFGSTAPAPTSPQTPEDPLFSLIRLHSDPALSLSTVLDPRAFGPDERWGGIGMCWHLYMILSRIMRVRDFWDRERKRKVVNGAPNGRHASSEDDFDESEWEDGHSPTADLLASSYAFQLENWGMIQEAVFVLLHVESNHGREKAVKDLLARSAPKMDDWMTRGLLGSLKIPPTWVNEAKAMYALDQGDVFDAYELYLSAQLFNSSHDLAVSELAPDAILRRDLDLLKRLFEPFDVEGRRDKIDGWFVRGKIFLDFVNIMTRVPILQDEIEEERDAQGEDTTIPDAARADELDDLTRKIPKLIALLPDVLHRSRAVDDRHVASIEEMTHGLLGVMGKAKPSMMLKQPILNFMDGATKISLIRGKGYARFLQHVNA